MILVLFKKSISSVQKTPRHSLTIGKNTTREKINKIKSIWVWCDMIDLHTKSQSRLLTLSFSAHLKPGCKWSRDHNLITGALIGLLISHCLGNKRNHTYCQAKKKRTKVCKEINKWPKNTLQTVKTLPKFNHQYPKLP